MSGLNGPIPVMEWLDFYLPEDQKHPWNSLSGLMGIPCLVQDTPTPEAIASHLINALNRFFPSHGLAFYPSGADGGPEVVGVFSDALTGTAQHILDSAAVFILCRPENSEDEQPQMHLEDMIEAAREAFARRWRTWTYGIHATQKMVAFFRFDAWGITYTEDIPYTGGSTTLQLFLWRFLCSSHVTRGFDETVDVADYADAEKAKKALGEWGAYTGDEGESLMCTRNVYKVFVPYIEDPLDIDRGRMVFVWMPIHQSTFPGRCTRIFPVFDPTDQKIRCLKDSWRAKSDVGKEEYVLFFLRNKAIPYVPRLVDGAIVPSAEHTVKNPWRKAKVVTEFEHYRIMTEEVLCPFTHFESSKELVRIMSQCLEAHEQANQAGVLYSNFSPENVIRSPKTGEGILVGWSQATLNASLLSSKSYSRPHFLSPSKDIYKAIKVFIYVTLRYIEHCHSTNVGSVLHEFKTHEDFLYHFFVKDTHFNFIGRPSLTKIVRRLAVLLWNLAGNEELPPRSFTHASAQSILKPLLETKDWPDGDCSVDFLGTEVQEELAQRGPTVLF